MKKANLLSVLFLLTTVSMVAQSEEEVYKFSIDIETAIEEDTAPWKYQMGATEYSISGYYKKALITWDKNGVRVPVISGEDSLYFSGFSPVCAREYIIERSKNEQIIIINEAHTVSKHRTFTHSLLQGLYDNGYRYLGLEALWETDVNERKFPILESGHYTKEPEFGNLIYSAINIGFTVFGYEATGGENGREREIAQARNIVDFIERHPPGKLLIHCGHDHVNEGAHSSWEKAMAGRIKEYTQIDPFTIEQTRFTERGDKIYNHPFIAMVNRDFPVILEDMDGNLFNGRRGDQIDCVIVHPETQYINDRPNWLFMGENRKDYLIDRSKIVQYPLLVLAYRQNEFDNNGVPADVIEIVENEGTPSLILEKGNYEIIVKDRNYSIINRYDVKIE